MIDSIITSLGRNKTAKYLEFEHTGNLTIPGPKSGKEYLLYLHIPFCEVLCPYCSFNRIPFEQETGERYFRALTREMDHYASIGYSFDSIYIGGGTPTVLPEELRVLLKRASGLWPINNISVETNPNHLTPSILNTLLEAGVTRLSVGVQTFDDALLQKLQRYGKYGSGEETAERLSTTIGIFNTLNIDMIYNFPDQTEKLVRNDLDVIGKLQPDQVTYYPLMASKLKKQEISTALGNVDYHKEKQLYSVISKTLSREYQLASAWCFSRTPGLIDEYIVDYHEYAGIGAGSFGYLDGTLYSNTFSVPEYIEILERGDLPLAGKRNFSLKEKLQYELLMSLFSGSLDIESIQNTYGNKGIRLISPILAALRVTGAVKREGNTFITTKKGNYYFVILMREFFNGVNTLREQRMACDGL